MKNESLKHVAIIMDGNGRWAQSRAHTRVWGHIRGSRIVSQIVEEADDCDVKALTLYAFSTENWSRPTTEVKVLFKLLKKFLLKERKKIIKNKVRFKVMGDTSNLPEDTLDLIADLENESKDHQGLKLTFAFGYGGKAEILHAANEFHKNNPGKVMTEEDLDNYLYLNDLGDVDLLIRTGGDQRISNFLLWQSAYAELFFTKTQWPDFTRDEFREIIRQCSERERRFGAISGGKSLKENIVVAKTNKKQIKEA